MFHVSSAGSVSLTPRFTHLAECFLMGLCGEHEPKTPPTFHMKPEKEPS